MKTRNYISLFACATLTLSASEIKAQNVALISDGNTLTIEAQQTQTEVKPGWKIVDIQLKSKMLRYLWGAMAKQYTDTPRPQFIVHTDTLLLSDMALVKLNAKKEYRKIPKPLLHNNKRIMVDLSTFSIEAYGDESFLIQPLQDLQPGEYIFTWGTRATVGELEDWIVWPFSVQ